MSQKSENTRYNFGFVFENLDLFKINKTIRLIGIEI